MAEDLVLLEKDPAAHIARLTLNNPSRRNAIAGDMRERTLAYLDDVAMDDDIKVLILRGAGGTFTTGADLSAAYDWYGKEGDTRRPSQRRRLAVDRHNQRWYHAYLGFPKVTIAQVEKYALGAGIELALSSDLVVIGRDAKVGMPATRMLGPILGNLHLFFHRLGSTLAKEMLLTGRMFDAAELEPLKIFTKTVEPECVAEETEELAALVAKMPADGIHMAKEAYRLVETMQGYAAADICGYLFHTFGTNLRFEPDEYNFVRTRAASGTTEALQARDRFFDEPK